MESFEARRKKPGREYDLLLPGGLEPPVTAIVADVCRDFFNETFKS
jgi:hypothetical protein